MKICIVCPEYPPSSHGGIGVVNQVVARALAHRGHDVRVLGTYPASDTQPDYAEDAGVRVWRFRESKNWIADRRRIYRQVAEWSRTGEIDLVEVADWGGAAAYWPKMQVPVIARVHGSVVYFSAEMNRPAPAMTRRLETASMRRADAWVAVSRYAAEQTQKLFGLQKNVAAILYNPVTLDAPPRTKLPAGRRVVFTGTLTQKKGVVELIAAWPAVLAACPDAELHLLGKDGRTDDSRSMQEFLKAQLPGGNVVFHGHVGRAEVLQQLQEARVAVFPSYSEAFALAPLEAMGCGCPTIYSRRSSGPELVRDGVDGLLIDPAQPSEISQAIVRVLQDDALAGRLGEAGARRIRERFSVEQLAGENEEFYERAIAEFHRREFRPPLQKLTGWRKGTASAQALPDCCLAVPTYRRPDTIVALLEKLTGIADPPAEVAVVDGSPDESTAQAVNAWASGRTLPFEFRFVRSPAGLTRQRNVGVDATTKEFVFFLDDDCQPESGYFRAIRAAFATDPAIGAVGGSAINEMNKPVSARWKIRFALGLVPRGEPGRYYPTATSVPRSMIAPFTGTRPTDILHGAAFACRRAVFARERFTLFFAGYSQGEDLEMARRIARNWKLVWCGDAHAIHEQAPAGRPASYQKGRMEVRNRYFIWRRHTARPTPGCRVKLWLDFAYILAYDLVSMIARPRQRGFLAHALGVAGGMVSCLASPPQYQEPPARRAFEFTWEKK